MELISEVINTPLYRFYKYSDVYIGYSLLIVKLSYCTILIDSTGFTLPLEAYVKYSYTHFFETIFVMK